MYLEPARKVLKVVSTAEAAYLLVRINAFPQPTLQWFHNSRLLHDSVLYQMKYVHGGGGGSFWEVAGGCDCREGCWSLGLWVGCGCGRPTCG